MTLLLDIGNTHTHLGLANRRRVLRQANIPTAAWANASAEPLVAAFAGKARIEGAALCSVVPSATPLARQLIKRRWSLPALELTHQTVSGIRIKYPQPETIGPDRLANAV